MKTISNSLFNTFDKNGTGRIAFEDMLIAMIPGANQAEMNKMIGWVNLMYMDKEAKKKYMKEQEQLQNAKKSQFSDTLDEILMGDDGNESVSSFQS